MTAPELAAAMERNAYTLDDGTPCRCERCAHHRDAARLLRELEAVRVLAEASVAGFFTDVRGVEFLNAGDAAEPMRALRTALRGVGGGA